MVVIGIDPGTTGAIAFVGPGDRVVIKDIPTVDLTGNGLVRRRVAGRELADVLLAHCPVGLPATVFVEAVATMGGRNNAVQTQGSLMRSLGAIETVVEMLRWPLVMVTPRDWQAFYKLAGKKTEKRERGEMPASIDRAIALYPQAVERLSRVKDHNRAEALLIAHYGVRYIG
jgi:hypothetical protein